jgi:hypothetical protein
MSGVRKTGSGTGADAVRRPEDPFQKFEAKVKALQKKWQDLVLGLNFRRAQAILIEARRYKEDRMEMESTNLTPGKARDYSLDLLFTCGRFSAVEDKARLLLARTEELIVKGNLILKAAEESVDSKPAWAHCLTLGEKGVLLLTVGEIIKFSQETLGLFVEMHKSSVDLIEELKGLRPPAESEFADGILELDENYQRVIGQR